MSSSEAGAVAPHGPHCGQAHTQTGAPHQTKQRTLPLSTVHFKRNRTGPRLKRHFTHEVWNTLRTQLVLLHLRRYLAFNESDDTCHQMAQDVIKMPQVKQYTS
jgi:hypothetical protein